MFIVFYGGQDWLLPDDPAQDFSYNVGNSLSRRGQRECLVQRSSATTQMDASPSSMSNEKHLLRRTCGWRVSSHSPPATASMIIPIEAGHGVTIDQNNFLPKWWHGSGSGLIFILFRKWGIVDSEGASNAAPTAANS
jgi:hypothetical protein